ncbi:MAG: iron ABC transporter permease [Rhodobacteraceae bacterium]|nr:iron ABC transporter permease [Paracoccaceae bacterium]MCZ8082956.1 iron ABC transporter permease [Paracoccaceae bacterium]
MSQRFLLTLLGLLVAVLFLASLLIGPAALGLSESLSALLSGEGGPVVLVMQEIRLPRAILGLLVGAVLGLSGAAMQGFLRNPLAEPGLIGVSSSAALGAVLSLQTGLAAAFTLALPLAALAGAALSVLLILALAGPRGGALSLILAGIAISALTGAGTQLVLNLSANPFAVMEIVYWMMGSLADRSMTHVWIAAPFMLAGSVMLLSTGRALDALTLGEDAAQSMGVSLRRLRLMIILGTASAIGASVAVAGAIGFVGLVIPHLLRPLTGGQPSRLLPAAMLGGAAMLLASDVAVRLIAPDQDLKLGVLTALIGAPFFLHLLWRMRGVEA